MLTYQMVEEKKVDRTITFTGPGDVAEALAPYRELDQEYFLVLHLDTQNRIKAVKIATIGLINQSLIDVREVFHDAIIAKAAAIIIAHNHPGGEASPSSQDKEITKKLTKAGDLLGIQVLDHVIVTKDSYYSFKNQ